MLKTEYTASTIIEGEPRPCYILMGVGGIFAAQAAKCKEKDREWPVGGGQWSGKRG